MRTSFRLRRGLRDIRHAGNRAAVIDITPEFPKRISGAGPRMLWVKSHGSRERRSPSLMTVQATGINGAPNLAARDCRTPAPWFVGRNMRQRLLLLTACDDTKVSRNIAMHYTLLGTPLHASRSCAIYMRQRCQHTPRVKACVLFFRFRSRCFRQSEVANFALCHEIGHRAHGILDWTSGSMRWA